MLFKLLPLLLALALSGCAIREPAPITMPEVEVDAVDPTPAPETTSSPAPEIPVPSEPETFGPRVAVVLSARVPAYENVATELGELLEDYSIYDLADKSQTPRELFLNIAAIDPDIVVAIGLRAATVAKSYSQVPVVFCQVFNVSDNDLTSGNIKGVSALPPLALQVEAWKKLNPDLKDIGAILGSGHDSLIEEANQVSSAAGLILHHRVVGSDRETLYMFNRLAPDIDGFWLFPDNRVLSPSVLRQILSYASRHQVQVAVFNPELLDLGATLSTKSVDSDIAATVIAVARRVTQGNSDSIPSMTPLNEVSVEANRAVLKKLELAAASTAAAQKDEGAL